MNQYEQSILADMALNGSNGVRRKAIKKVKDQNVLAEVAKNDLKPDIRILALKRLTNQEAIFDVAKNDRKTDIRLMALKKLTEQTAISEVAKNDLKTDIRRIALKKLTNPEDIYEVAKNDPNFDNRKIALKKLKKFKVNVENITEKSNDSDDNKQIDINIFEKISLAIYEIDLLNNSINDEIISNEIAVIKNILNKMAAFLKEEKNIEQRVAQLDEFLGYYFPTIVKIIDSYRQITEHGLDSENAVETKKRIAESIPVIRKAFEKQFDNMYENKMFDITTDIDVLETMLAQDGILDKSQFT
jgi:hypothetical protein